MFFLFLQAAWGFFPTEVPPRPEPEKTTPAASAQLSSAQVQSAVWKGVLTALVLHAAGRYWWQGQKITSSHGLCADIDGCCCVIADDTARSSKGGGEKGGVGG